jgi:hypothetical protein
MALVDLNATAPPLADVAPGQADTKGQFQPAVGGATLGRAEARPI